MRKDEFDLIVRDLTDCIAYADVSLVVCKTSSQSKRDARWIKERMPKTVQRLFNSDPDDEIEFGILDNGSCGYVWHLADAYARFMNNGKFNYAKKLATDWRHSFMREYSDQFREIKN